MEVFACLSDIDKECKLALIDSVRPNFKPDQ